MCHVKVKSVLAVRNINWQLGNYKVHITTKTISFRVIYNKVEMFGTTGASLIRMMNHFLGEETLKRGLTNYLEAHKFRYARQDDLWDQLTLQAHQDGSLPQRMTVKEIMDTWTLQTGYPVVTVTRNYVNGSAYISQVSLCAG